MNLSDIKLGGSAAETVENIKNTGMLPHAVIIEGDGEAPLKLAVYLSAYAVCAGEKKPCGVCKSCRNALAGTHADISYIVPEKKSKSKTLSIEQIRVLIKDSYIKPNDGDAKVYIFENADTVFTEITENAFLKLLEEPPKGVYFILICKSSRGFLPTVLSRCSIIKLGGASEFGKTATEAAERIIEGMISPSEYDLLKALRALNDKTASGDILNYVKLVLFDAVAILSGAEAKYSPLLSKKLSSHFTRQRLLAMIELTDSANQRIKQNININLLTTWLCGEYRRISWQR